MPEESEGGGGGGFMDEELEAQGLQNVNEMEGAGGFLTSDQDDSTTRPTFSRISPPPPTGGLLRIPLRNIPTALAALDLPPNQQVLSLFKEVASDDEEGELTVSKERFVQVLGVLMGGDDDSDSEAAVQEAAEEEEEEQEELSELTSSDDDEEEEEYREEVKISRGRKGATRRITRASGGVGDGTDAIEEGALSDNNSQDSSSGMDVEGTAPLSSKAKGKSIASTTKRRDVKSRKITKAEQKKLDRTRAVTDREIEQAISTFSLFFEGGNPPAGKKDNRKIGLKELRRACDLIKEDIDEDDVSCTMCRLLKSPVLVLIFDGFGAVVIGYAGSGEQGSRRFRKLC